MNGRFELTEIVRKRCRNGQDVLQSSFNLWNVKNKTKKKQRERERERSNRIFQNESTGTKIKREKEIDERRANEAK